MKRFALLLTLPLLACGDDTVADATSSGTTVPVTTTGITPTTGATDMGTTGDAPETTGSGGHTGSSSSSTTGTTQVVDASSSTGDGITGGTTGGTTDGTTGSTTEDGTSSTGEDSSSGSSSDTGDTEGMQPLVSGECMTNDLMTFVEPMAFDHELHIIGVYEPTAGMITVAVDRVGIPISLVLSSYEPAAFNLVLAPGVELVEVILNGYEMHSVQGQGDADVIDFSGPGNSLTPCAYEWPGDVGGCETPVLVSETESLTGLSLSSFAGCYQGAAFTLK